METSLTIPNQDNFSSIKKAGVFILGTSARSSPMDVVANYISQVRSSGGNYFFVEAIRPNEVVSLDSAELYTRAIQRIRGISTTQVSCEENGLPLDDREKLQVIREVFSPTGQQLADAMGVSRTTVYNWLDGQSEMRAGNQQRLEPLYELADFWRSQRSSSRELRSSEKRKIFRVVSEGTDDAISRAKEHLIALMDGHNRPRPKSIQQLQKERGLKEWSGELSEAAMASRTRTISSLES
jgi:transcriptional regulator with XRE-family HTH domain